MLRHRGTDRGLQAPRHEFTNVLVPLDGSDLADSALPHATALAKAFEARLTLLRVVAPLPAPAALYAVPFAIPPQQCDDTLSVGVEGAQSYLEAIATRLRG